MGSSLIGVLIDALTKYFKENESQQKNATRKALFVTLGITSSIGTLFSVLMCIPSKNIQYFAFAVLLSLRSFLYGSVYVYVKELFPSTIYGEIVGFINLFSGILALIQHPLVSLSIDVFDGNFFPVD